MKKQIFILFISLFVFSQIHAKLRDIYKKIDEKEVAQLESKYLSKKPNKLEIIKKEEVLKVVEPRKIKTIEEELIELRVDKNKKLTRKDIIIAAKYCDFKGVEAILKMGYINSRKIKSALKKAKAKDVELNGVLNKPLYCIQSFPASAICQGKHRLKRQKSNRCKKIIIALEEALKK